MRPSINELQDDERQRDTPCAKDQPPAFQQLNSELLQSWPLDFWSHCATSLHVEHIRNMKQDKCPRLLDLPQPLVRLRCALCPRKGAYRLARLAAMFGHKADLDTVVYELSRNCPHQTPPWRRPSGKYNRKCGARLDR